MARFNRTWPLIGPSTGAEPDNIDDKVCGGSLVENRADHKLEAIRGADYRERLKSYRGGIDLKIRWRAGQWKWISEAWLDRDASLFLAERREFYKRGLGYFLRSRRIEKYRRPILPYKPPVALLLGDVGRRPSCS